MTHPDMPDDDALFPVKTIAAQFADLPQVAAVAVAGSLAARASDSHSDYDIYVYADAEIPVEARAAIAQDLADDTRPVEINNPYWGPEDAWIDRASGVKADLVFWSTGWIEEQLARVLVHHQASVGYSTCFWHTILKSTPIYDRDGWFADLKRRANQPYPEPLRRAIIVLNHPLMRAALPSYWNQLELAILRHDLVSANHRIAALLASYFDILFAANRVPHPGEKKLLQQAARLCASLPDAMEHQVKAVVCSVALPWNEQVEMRTVETLLDSLDRWLVSEGLINAPGRTG